MTTLTENVCFGGALRIQVVLPHLKVFKPLTSTGLAIAKPSRRHMQFCRFSTVLAFRFAIFRGLACKAVNSSDRPCVFVVHELSKVDVNGHHYKRDLKQITHEHDIGYKLPTSLLIYSTRRATIAPMQMYLWANSTVQSFEVKIPCSHDSV